MHCTIAPNPFFKGGRAVVRSSQTLGVIGSHRNTMSHTVEDHHLIERFSWATSTRSRRQSHRIQMVTVMPDKGVKFARCAFPTRNGEVPLLAAYPQCQA
jgi:hypothetical protein